MFQMLAQPQRALVGTYLSTLFTVGSHLCLYQNDYTPNPFTDIGDLTECDFGGYAQVDSGFAYTRTINPDQTINVGSIDPPGEFVADGSPPSPQTAYGCFVRSAANALMIARRFDTPVMFSQNGDTLRVIWPGLQIVNQFGAENDIIVT